MHTIIQISFCLPVRASYGSRMGPTLDPWLYLALDGAKYQTEKTIRTCIARHTARTIVLWSNAEQLLMFHISKWMMILRGTRNSIHILTMHTNDELSIWAAQLLIQEASHILVCAARAPYRSCMGPVRYGTHRRVPRGARTMPVRAPYGALV